MTAILGTSANLQTGIKYFGQTSNVYGGYLTSNGSAYNLPLPFQPDMFEFWRQTAFGTAGIVGTGVWFRDMPAGYALETQAIADNGITGNLNNVLATSNGFTLVVTPAAFAAEQIVITGITAATPGVVTTTSPHGYSNGQRVIITGVVGTLGPSVNNQTFVVNVLSSTTFGLYDIYGIPWTTSGTYTSGGQSNLTGPKLGVVDAPASYVLTLGTNVMGSNADLIYFRASQFNSYYNLGTV